MTSSLSVHLSPSPTDHNHLNNAALSPLGPAMALSHPHNNLGIGFNKYTSLKPVGESLLAYTHTQTHTLTKAITRWMERTHIFLYRGQILHSKNNRTEVLEHTVSLPLVCFFYAMSVHPHKSGRVT